MRKINPSYKRSRKQVFAYFEQRNQQLAYEKYIKEMLKNMKTALESKGEAEC